LLLLHTHFVSTSLCTSTHSHTLPSHSPVSTLWS
jgi:hypothetical protein